MERIKIEDGKGTVARERRELRALYGIHRSDALSRLLDSCENEAHLNANLQLLIYRLHIQRDREKSPRIAEKAIIAPLFITGLPRTGATLLRGLLAQDQTPINGAVIAASSISDAGSAERLRVLLADDHPAMLALTADALAGECFVVGSVGDGRELLAEAERLHPNVIVLDITMPRLDSIEAARQLRRSHRPARLVFLTVHEDADSPRPHSMRAGSAMSLRRGSLPPPACHPGSARRLPLHLAHRAPR
jgi:CheY-like chemotaxis protein